jgi:hypothetical protein
MCVHDLCDYSSYSKLTLAVHSNAVHAVKCEFCDFSTPDLSHLDQHKKLVHFQCTKCSNNFASKKGLKRHIKIVHSKIRNFTCDHCDKKFGTNWELKRHINTVHTKLRYFPCDVECPFFRTFFFQKKSQKNPRRLYNLHFKKINSKISKKLFFEIYIAFLKLKKNSKPFKKKNR